MRLVKLLSTAFAASALAMVATPASATIQITSYSLDSTARSGTIHVGNLGLNQNVAAGRFNLSGTNLDTSAAVAFQTFCIDITSWFTNNSTYNLMGIAGANLDPARQAQLAALVINGTSLIGSASGVTTAIQLAIWEVLYENSGTYNVASGNFSADGGFASSQALANSYLANVTSGAWTGDTNRIGTLVAINGSQSQVFQNAVPEPGTWAMMLLGFGAIGFAMRRSKRTTQVKFASIA